MTDALLAITAVFAVLDWLAVARGLRTVELAAKPLTLLVLLAAAASAHLGDVTAWLVLALAFGLVGDVALLFAGDQASADDLDPAFLAGLGAFLLGHLAYLVAFSRHGQHGGWLGLGIGIAVVASAVALPAVLRGARATGGLSLAAVVAGYAVVLGAMVAFAVGTGAVATAIGGLIFMASDTTLAWGRFVRPLRGGPVLVIVTYHVAQVLIVIGLLR